MKSGTLSRCLTAAILAGFSAVVYAEVKENPYQIIIERNPFALKDPPIVVPPVATEPTNTPPPIEVKLTGITDLLGRVQVFLQLQNQQTKKFDYPRPLEVGDQEGDIQILAIDKEAGVVRIRNGDAETSLDFEKNGVKPGGTAVAGSPVPPPPGMVPLRVPPPAPGVSPSYNNSSSGNVSVSGGAPTTAAVPGAPSFGGAIPSRPMRSEAGNVLIGGGGVAANTSPTPQPQVRPNQNPEEVMRDIEARRQIILQKEQAGQALPGSHAILPPTRYTPPPPPAPR